MSFQNASLFSNTIMLHITQRSSYSLKSSSKILNLSSGHSCTFLRVFAKRNGSPFVGGGGEVYINFVSFQIGFCVVRFCQFCVCVSVCTYHFSTLGFRLIHTHHTVESRQYALRFRTVCAKIYSQTKQTIFIYPVFVRLVRYFHCFLFFKCVNVYQTHHHYSCAVLLLSTNCTLHLN